MDLKDRITQNPKIKKYIIIGTLPIVAMFIGFVIVIQRIGLDNFNDATNFVNEHLSLFAMCVYVWVTDTFILPLSPMFVFPMLISYPWYLAIAATGLASCLGGISAYLMGWLIVKIPFINRAVLGAYEKWGDYINKYGTPFVLIGSIFPLPFSAICMAAGVMKLNFRKVCIYSSTRVLRMAIYYFMFYLGLMTV